MKLYYIQEGKIFETIGSLGEGYDLSVTCSYDDYLAGKIIKLNQEQVDFYINNPKATAAEVFHMELDEGAALLKERSDKLNAIKAFDKSSDVNSFMINGNDMWLDRDTRASLSVTIAAYKSQGKRSITLWTEGNNPLSITIPIDSLKVLLLSLEIYAKECYDITAMHKHVVSNLETIAEIRDYDYTSGYPEKLNITTA